MAGIFSTPSVPAPYNEPMFDYAPGTKERAGLKAACEKVRSEVVEIPCVVNGKEHFTGNVFEQVMPTDHGKVIARVHLATPELIAEAATGALEARKTWAELPFTERAAVFLRAADLLSGERRFEVMAANMLGQGKNPWQSEIDAAAELCDFLRFNCKYAEEIYAEQPPLNSKGVWNRVEYRPLEGFVYAIAPFNFTAITGNLACAPALMGNVVLLKPGLTAALSGWRVYQLLQEAGLPAGVVQWLPSHGPEVSNVLLPHPDLAGIHFTGSTGVFQMLWGQVGENIKKYKSYPRVVGETGGKNMHFVHPSADIDAVINETVRSAFEFQGQKCSACSRMYAPKSKWEEIRAGLEKAISEIKVGQPDNFDNFMTAVIDKRAYDRVSGAIEQAKKDADADVILGGKHDDSKGYFIHPTVILAKDPKYATMRNELFGPVLTVYVYEDADFEATLKIADETSMYALTGSIFARDRVAVNTANVALRNAAGNFYINTKCTGAVVGQQPFGGARGSGTDDKAGAAMNLYRWVSARTVKEGTKPLRNWRYPHMAGDEPAAKRELQ